MTDAKVHYFGVRHHGPGSARAVLDALDALRPTAVLIEGPVDASPLLPLLDHPQMTPPVALLAYAEDDQGAASFWPFAEFSPEYQAAVWAARNGAAASFIDLPAGWRLPSKSSPKTELQEPQNELQELQKEPQEPQMQPDADRAASDSPPMTDPIGALADAAGYGDGESWWRDVIEDNPNPGPIFDAVSDAMAALRATTSPLEPFEAAREAHMRLEIAKALKAADGPVAVVCGAWHVPALMAKHTQKDDRAVIKSAQGDTPKRKVATAWVPWTMPRLASMGGYGAGVQAPAWCAHLWESRDHVAARWLGKMAHLLRADGHLVSTASLIEAERLATTLAAMRDRPGPGFEELRESALACLCGGQSAQLDSISDRLLIGADVGRIPDDSPRAPLLEDLQRQQKKARLKPEALAKDLALDLRSDSGLFRSTLLHRLEILDAPWGRLIDPGGSRGTFREKWALEWRPEYAVALVENIAYGPTIEQAVLGRLTADLKQAEELGALAALTRRSMIAQSPTAAAVGVERLQRRAALTSDCGELLRALPPLADLTRYGEARDRTDDAAQIKTLLERAAAGAAVGLPYAARGLDAAAAIELRDAVASGDRAIRLAEIGAHDMSVWEDALLDVVSDDRAAPLVAGSAAQLMLAAERLTAEDAGALLGRKLSPGVPVADAAGFFEGFFDGGAAQRLLYDDALRGAVDGWIILLEEETFTAYLPLFRRVFSSLDKSERARLLDALFSRGGSAMVGLALRKDAAAAFNARLPELLEILTPA